MLDQQYGQSRTAMPAPLLTPQHRLGQAGSAGAVPPPSPLSTRLLWLCPNHRPLLSPLISALEGLRQSSSPQPQSSTGCELQVDEEQGPTVGPGLAVTSHFAGSRRLGLAGPEVARLLRDSGRVGMMPTASSKARHSCVSARPMALGLAGQVAHGPCALCGSSEGLLGLQQDCRSAGSCAGAALRHPMDGAAQHSEEQGQSDGSSWIIPRY